VEDTATEWTSEDEPEAVGAGFFVYASLIDWDAGALKTELMESENLEDHLFWDADPHLDSNFENPIYSVSLQGLCFERGVIEMLQPSADLAADRRESVELHARRGRPRVWDWEGATMHLLMRAQHPDGLPTGPGAQAHIERLISDWFAETTGNTPSASQVRQHAGRIMHALKMPESR
jgi:hypothetical protein